MTPSDGAGGELTNAEVARLRALSRDRRARHEAGRFVVEGAKLVAEALASDLTVFETIAASGWDQPDEFEAALRRNGLGLTIASRRAIDRIASTTSPQPVLAEVGLPRADWSDLALQASLLVALDVNDPGNLGTLIRSAVAAGFDAVACLGDTVDAYSPKAIRASAGAIFRVPVIIDRDATGGLTQIAQRGITRYGTRMNNAIPCDEADLGGSLALVLGSEAHGLRDDYDDKIDGWLSVPMPGRTESLNVAMAGTILAYEVARQRRARSK